MNMIEQMDNDRVATRNRYRDKKKYAKKVRPNLAAVANALIKVNDKLIDVTVCANEIDLSYSGDHHTLNVIFNGLRGLGYAPSARPAKNDPRFTCRWNHPDNSLQIYFSFSSTKCTRIKVGDKMVKVDVYETVCE